VKTTISTGIGAALSTLATERSVTLPAPDADAGYWAHLREPLQKDIEALTMPAILIAAVKDAAETHDSGDLAGHRDKALDLIVAVLVQAPDLDTSDLLLGCYMDAVVSTLPTNNLLGSWWVSYQGTDWNSRSLTPSGKNYTLQAVACAYQVTVFDQ
jgi:hypothetical protein